MLNAWLDCNGGDCSLALSLDLRRAALVLDAGSAIDMLAALKARDGRPQLYVRLSPLDSDRVDAELDAILPLAPDGVVLAACRGGADVQRLGVKLAVREALHDLPAGSTRIVAMVAARALLGLSSYVGCSPRLHALGWDADALAADLGVRNRDASPLRSARDWVLIAARAAGVAALDATLDGLPGLRAETQRARDDGFSGKFARTVAEAEAIAAAFGATG